MYHSADGSYVDDAGGRILVAGGKEPIVRDGGAADRALRRADHHTPKATLIHGRGPHAYDRCRANIETNAHNRLAVFQTDVIGNYATELAEQNGINRANAVMILGPDDLVLRDLDPQLLVPLDVRRAVIIAIDPDVLVGM